MADRLSVRSTVSFHVIYSRRTGGGGRECAQGTSKRVWAMPTKPRFQGETVGFLIRPED